MNEQVGWVLTRSGQVFTGLHLPNGAARATAVVLVPPFGWEGVSAGRNLRSWARGLAADGYPTVRYHPPGAGDSSGESHHQDLGTWSQALVDVVLHTRRATGCTDITLIGLGLGGIVALKAMNDGAEAEELVLWSTPSKGRLLLRELRAFAAMAAEPGEPVQGAPQPLDAVTSDDGVLWVHGYPLGAKAQEQLTAFDVSTLDLSHLERALVLGRGTLPPDKRLVQAILDGGTDVVSLQGPGYDELTVEPRLSQPAVEVVAAVRSWLNPEPGSHVSGSLELTVTNEQRVDLGQVDGVITNANEPVLTAVFIGAGAISRSGPNRLWAEAARRWADWGVSSLRIDLHGIGEAPGPDAYPFGPEGFYDEVYRPQVQDVLDRAVELGLPPRFLLVGLCSGGFWSAQLALEDPRVSGIVVLNAVSLVWPPPLLSAESRQYLRSRETWSRFMRDPHLRKEAMSRARRSGQLMVSRVRKHADKPMTTSLEVLLALDDAGVPVSVGASPGEQILKDLELLPPGARTVVRTFHGPDGAHTLSTAGLRHQAEQLMDDAARRAVATIRDPAGVPR